MMPLNAEQQRKVEANLGLVHKVIQDKVHGISRLGIYSYDDIFQIGCLGLCKAAATDKGGTFSTYAYRLIWNNICDALIYATRRQNTELLTEDTAVYSDSDTAEDLSELQIDLSLALSRAKRDAVPSIRKGIDVLVLNANGYSSQDAGQQLGLAANNARALASKAKKYLAGIPEMKMLHLGVV